MFLLFCEAKLFTTGSGTLVCSLHLSFYPLNPTDSERILFLSSCHLKGKDTMLEACKLRGHKWRLSMRASVFCSTALTSTGWVRMTIKPQHCPPFLSSAAVIETKRHQIFLKNLGTLGIKPGQPGREAWMLPLCYGNPPTITLLYRAATTASSASSTRRSGSWRWDQESKTPTSALTRRNRWAISSARHRFYRWHCLTSSVRSPHYLRLINEN